MSPFEGSVTMLYGRSTGNWDESVQQAMTAPKEKRLAPGARAAERVEAGLRVLSKGGITAFAIDTICRRQAHRASWLGTPSVARTGC